MKHLLFILSLFLSAYSIAQKNEWAPVGAVWHYNLQEYGPSPYRIGYAKIEAIKDTVVLGKNCKILQKTRVTPNSYFIIDTIDDGIEIMYSDSDKVYRFINGSFYVLYDFSAKQGDTLQIKEPYYSGISTDTLIEVLVDSVSSEIINNNNSRVLYLSTISSGWVFSGKVIEKIGSMYYLFPQSDLDCDGSSGCISPLRCYEDSLFSYKRSPNQICDTVLVLTLSIKTHLNKNIKIFPNPFNDILKIKFNPDFDKETSCSLFIYNINGELIHEEHQVLNQNIDINLSRLSNGIFFLMLNYNDLYFIKKIIKN